MIEYQFNQLDARHGEDRIIQYDAGKFQAVEGNISRSMHDGYPVSGEYILATLSAFNATEDAVKNDDVDSDVGAPEPGSGEGSFALRNRLGWLGIWNM